MNKPFLAELLAERYGAPVLPDQPPPGHGDGGPDTALNVARRRRDLCDALEDAPSALRVRWAA